MNGAPPFCYYGHRATTPDSPGYLQSNLLGGHHPEQAFALRHLGVNKSGTDIRHIDRETTLASFLAECLSIINLESLGGRVGWRTGLAALTSHGTDYGKMASALGKKSVEDLINEASPPNDVSIERSNFFCILQLRVKFAHSSTDNDDIHYCHVLPYPIQPYWR